MLSLSEDEESINNDFDTSWINEFEKVDKDYTSFYLEDLTYVKVTIIYINIHNEIEKIKEDKIFLNSSNNISRNEIIGILKRNNTKEGKIFTIMTMLKYNLDLEPTDIRNFLINKEDSSFLSTVKEVDEIVWNKTISMFQDLNNLFIIFYENEKIKTDKKSELSKTKRIFLKSTQNHSKTLKIKMKTA